MTTDQLIAFYNQVNSPYYAYDGHKIVTQIQRLQGAFNYPNVQFFYAMKALNNKAVLQLMLQNNVGIDAVSIYEAKWAIACGFNPAKILFTPNGVGFEEIQAAVQLGLTINLDNLSVLEQFGMHYGKNYPIGIRINPHIMAGGHSKISVGHIDSKFGISMHQVRHIERLVQKFDIDVIGLHMHTGSEIIDNDAFVRGADILMDIAMNYFPKLSYIDLGSGFKVAYRTHDTVTDIEDFGTTISNRILEFIQKYQREIALYFEPGKYLVSEAGRFITKVNTVKQTTSTVFVGVDSGFNHLIRPMFYESYHEIENISYPQGRKRIYTVVGYICETDTFGWDRSIAEVNEGDLLMFHNAGAYGYTMSSNYNMRPKPAEALFWNNKLHLIRRAESFKDLIGTQLDTKNIFTD